MGAFLVAMVTALLIVMLGSADPAGARTVAVVSTPVEDVPVAPPETVSDFYPESANLSDCVGLVEKPGCGSESRGGWRQVAVFAVLFAGLGLILWRVSRGISANRAVIDASGDADADHA